MQLDRRQLLGAGLVAALPLATTPVEARLLRPQPLEITATPIRSFSPRYPEQARFGQLNFRGGLQLSARHPDFGGWSGLSRSGNGRQLISISDNGFWLTADVTLQDGRLAGLASGVIAPILGADGTALWRTRSYDCEGLSIVGGVAHVSIERTHEVMRFEFGRDGVLARGHSLPVPREVKRLPSNRSLEAVGVMPEGHRLAGTVIAIAERSGGMEEPTAGFLLGGSKTNAAHGLFQVKRSKGFDITDLAFLPGGDMVLLERWYAPLRGVGMRIRRIDGHSIGPGALLDGETLIEADLGEEIDNMEGLAVHQQGAKTILTLISDDNFSMIQRTILLEFEMA